MAAFVVMALVPIIAPWAIKKGFVDHPGGRKKHDAPVPHIGGFLIVLSFIGCHSYFIGQLALYWPLYLGLFMLVLIGMIDDHYEINAWAKFGTQFTAAILIVVFGGAELHHLGNLFGFGLTGLGPFSIFFSVIAVVLLINAINLMDGIDGLAGGQGFIVFFWLFVASIMAGMLFDHAGLFIIGGAVFGFLVYNMRTPFRRKASIFLGDAGSTALGLIIGWYAIHLASGEVLALPPISVAWILALPIMDTCAQFNRRVRAGRDPFAPDRGHFHHHFLDAGLTPACANAYILLIVFITGGVGVLGSQLDVPEWALCGLWIVIILTHMWMSLKPERYVMFIRRVVYA